MKPSRPVTFEEVLTRAEHFAAGFVARGVRPRQIVVLMLPTHREAAAAFFGAVMSGAIPSFFPPVSPKQDAAIFWASHGALFVRNEVALIVSDRFNISLIGKHLIAFEARCFDIDAEFPAAPSFTCAIDQSDIAFLQHSSGTTGLKKGVAITHGMVLAHTDILAETLAITPSYKIISWLPPDLAR